MQIGRVLRVTAKVSAGLDDDVALASLAAAARTSPFHLQREVKAVLGESPRALAERLRLERAAARLLAGEEPIVDIALDVGFASHETFTRAFRRRFGISPTAYRARGLDVPSAATSHASVTRAVGPCVGLFHVTQRSREMSHEVSKIEVPEQHVLFVRRKVRSSDIAKALGEVLPAVFAHAQRQGIALAGPPFCRYASWGPLMTLEAGFAVAGPGRSEGEIEAGTLVGGVVATTTHVGPYDTLGDAHAALETWADDARTHRRGPSWELYVTDPGEVPNPNEWRTEVFMPIEA